MRRLLTFLLLVTSCFAGETTGRHPKVVIMGINGGELDFILPLIMQGKLPNFQRVMENGSWGHLQTLQFAVCPKVYSTIETGVRPEDHGMLDFYVDGKPVETGMMKSEPLWSLLNKAGVTTGYFNVPATFPAVKVNGYMISGMNTQSTHCETGEMCPVPISQAKNHAAVYPHELETEILANVGDTTLDCTEIPLDDNFGKRLVQPGFITNWLKKTATIREEQKKLIAYLMEKHPTDFTFIAQSCEDRTGHWLYPVNPWNAGFRKGVQDKYRDALPNQYIMADKVLGVILDHIEPGTTVIVLSDHGIKPLHEPGEHHHRAIYVVAHHAFTDPMDVPGMFFAMGPGIKKGFQITSPISVLDIAPTVLQIYGIEHQAQMEGQPINTMFDRH